ncbi:GntT/GntP/DsdX family permease [Corynebacterium glyciniphilum]|uniref:GntT/GntP/DsdX family permease n=1 Tax=Corynebacterium glyciniphilum TaxID=1404244 RepID=UPI0011AB7BF3|nr:SLC13 family permease [Corynebacterium glyciniphilum]
MGAAYLIVLAIIAIAALLVLVTVLKWPAYIALLAIAVVTALAAGTSPSEVMPLIIDGMGSTLGSVALLVGLGAMLGGILEKSGSAAVLANSFRIRLGEKRSGTALLLAASLVAIPIFYDVAFIILVPIVYSFARMAGHRSPIILGLPIAPFMVYLHNTLPPHPGITAATGSLGGDVGVLLMMGLVIAVPVGFVAVYMAKLLNLKEYVMTPDVTRRFAAVSTSPHAQPIRAGGGDSSGRECDSGDAEISGDNFPGNIEDESSHVTTPATWEVLLCILLPLLMIAIGTVTELVLPEEHPVLEYTSFIGAPAFALLVAAILGYYLLGIRHKRSGMKVSEIMDDALGPAAVVVFVTGAGGVFAAVLTATGIGEAISDSLLATGMPMLPMAFLLAAALKAAQGSGTVAAQTTGGIIAATVLAGDFSTLQIALLLIAIGCGSNSLTHVNDSAFWITTRYLGLSVIDGLKTWSVMGLTLALTGFAITCGLWVVVP